MTYDTPQIEAYLKHLWQEMLQITEVSTTESFPALGGDSLVATRMLAEVLRVWGVSITLGEFYEADSISKLTALIQEHQACRADPSFEATAEGEPG